MAMAQRREPFAFTCSAVTGDDDSEPQHNMEHVVTSGASVAPVDDRGGGDGSGRFGIYQGSWGGRRRIAELPEMIN